jgi:hypothetical protein
MKPLSEMSKAERKSRYLLMIRTAAKMKGITPQEMAIQAANRLPLLKKK